MIISWWRRYKLETDVTQSIIYSNNLKNLLRSFGSNTPPLGAKIEFGFAKLFSKASKIPRLLAAGIFFIDGDNFDRF